MLLRAIDVSDTNTLQCSLSSAVSLIVILCIPVFFSKFNHIGS